MPTLFRLVRGPFLVSVALTLVRLSGELGRLPKSWFSTDTQGILPTGVSWIVGISWLPVLFGPYFLERLRGRSSRPSSARVLFLAVIGAAFVLGSRPLLPHIPLPFPRILLAVWVVMAAGAALQAWGWSPLFRALLLYGLASRLAVAFVMFLAMRGDWGTHYDYAGMPPAFQMPLLPRFLWLAFFPQLIFWVGFTVILGSLSAGFYGVLTREREERSA